MNKHLLSPLNIEIYNVYFKRYGHTCIKEILWLYASMKEFRLANDM
jgi:hypothetical protein